MWSVGSGRPGAQSKGSLRHVFAVPFMSGPETGAIAATRSAAWRWSDEGRLRLANGRMVCRVGALLYNSHHQRSGTNLPTTRLAAESIRHEATVRHARRVNAATVDACVERRKRLVRREVVDQEAREADIVRALGARRGAAAAAVEAVRRPRRRQRCPDLRGGGRTF